MANVTVVLSVFAFYATVVVLLGFVGASFVASTLPELVEPSPITFLLQAITTFTKGIFFSISNIPLWANTLLFLPLSITLGFVVISLLRGSS